MAVTASCTEVMTTVKPQTRRYVHQCKRRCEPPITHLHAPAPVYGSDKTACCHDRKQHLKVPVRVQRRKRNTVACRAHNTRISYSEVDEHRSISDMLVRFCMIRTGLHSQVMRQRCAKRSNSRGEAARRLLATIT